MPLGPQSIFVDGYNVIRNTPGLAVAEAAGLAAGREALLARLVGSYRHTPHTLVVVFDGDGAAESVQPIRALSRGRVIFTRRGETADAVIVRLAAIEQAHGCEVRVYSDDLEVRQASSAVGAEAARVADLKQQLDAPPRFLRKRMQHQTYMKQRWLADDPDAPRGAGPGDRSPHGRRPRK